MYCKRNFDKKKVDRSVRITWPKNAKKRKCDTWQKSALGQRASLSKKCYFAENCHYAKSVTWPDKLQFDKKRHFPKIVTCQESVT